MTDRTLTAADQDLLEQVLDRAGLQLVLGGLANICAGKSDHVLVNWQDRTLAGHWMKAMTALDKIADDNRSIVEVSR